MIKHWFVWLAAPFYFKTFLPWLGACGVILYGGGKDSDPPDYTPVAQASAEAARIGAELGREQLAESRRQYDNAMEVTRPVVQQQLQMAQQQQAQGNDYFNYNRQMSRPVENQLNYEAMGFTPEEVAQIRAARTTETEAARAAQAEQVQQQASIPNKVSIPTFAIADDLPAGAVKGSALGQKFIAPPMQQFQPGMGGLAAAIAASRPVAVDPNAYYVKGADGRYTVVQPRQKITQGTQEISIPNPQPVIDPNTPVDTPDTNALVEDLAMQASARQKAADASVRDEILGQNTELATRIGESDADVYARNKQDIDAETGQAVADSRSGYTNALNTAIRQGMRYGFSPDKLAATAGTTTLAGAQAQAAAANQTRKAATTTMYGRGIGESQQALQGLTMRRGQKQQDEAIQTAKKLDVAGLYRNLPGASQGSYSLALNAGNSAANNNIVPGQNLVNNQATAAGIQQQGLSTQVQGLSNILGNQTSVYNAGNDNGALWGALGSVAGGFIAASDKKVKKNVKDIDDDEALEGVSKTKVHKWAYDTAKGGPADGGKAHVGVMAQDAEKNLGPTVSNGREIDLISAVGVTMAATRALNKKVDRLLEASPPKKAKETA